MCSCDPETSALGFKLDRRRGDCRWLSVAECELGADGLGISVVYVVENG